MHFSLDERGRNTYNPWPVPDTRGTQSFGAIAQLGERYNGIVEVRSSILLGSTKIKPISEDIGFFIPISFLVEFACSFTIPES